MQSVSNDISPALAVIPRINASVGALTDPAYIRVRGQMGVYQKHAAQ